MSTRSTLTIKTDHTTINFYRHMDGYVAEAGNTLLHLLDKVVNAKNAWQHPAIKLAEEIMKQQYEATEYRTASPIYELTNDPSHYGDREYHYEVEMDLSWEYTGNYTNNITISVHKYGYDKSESNDGRYFHGNLEQYKKYVAQEVAEQQERLKAHEEKLNEFQYEDRKRPITVTGRRTQKV